MRNKPTRTISRLALGALAALLVLILAFAAGTALRRDDATDGAPGRTRPALTTGAQVSSLQQQLARNPDDTATAVQLAGAYLIMVRETGDPSWYGKAEALLTDVLARDAENAEALAWMGALELSRHNFAAALEWGQRARASDPDLLAAYPVLVDAYVELGRYAEAVATTDEFVALRPDLASYTRVSYLRELHGDRPGAIEAMMLALDTVAPGTEPGAWTRVQLGNLLFNGGDLDAAEREYTRTLAGYSEYAPATAGLARVVAARGDFAQAAQLLLPVTQRAPLPEYLILLGDIYTALADDTSAAKQYDLVRIEMRLLESSGANSDLELALFEADHPAAGVAPDAAVERARAAVAQRPSIYAHDALAWALYRAGAYDEARAAAEQALRLGTRDALLYYHAAAIAEAQGDTEQARQWYSTALDINPHFSILYADDAREATGAP